MPDQEINNEENVPVGEGIEAAINRNTADQIFEEEAQEYHRIMERRAAEIAESRRLDQLRGYSFTIQPAIFDGTAPAPAIMDYGVHINPTPPLEPNTNDIWVDSRTGIVNTRGIIGAPINTSVLEDYYNNLTPDTITNEMSDRVSDRLRNLSNELYREYREASVANHDIMILRYIRPEYAYLDTPKKKLKDNKVALTENPKQVIDPSEAISIRCLGYFKKDDPRLIDDYFYPNVLTYKLILDEKYTKLYSKVFNKIDEKTGELIFENNYTRAGKDFLDNSPQIVIANRYEFITYELLNSTIFNMYYKEDLSIGVFIKKESCPPFVKQLRRRGNKNKCNFSDFYRYMENVPNSYLGVLGKKYSYGVELETISGLLPLYLNKSIYFSAVHDGSLRDPENGETYGTEYVTDVLIGDAGLKQLKMLCYELSRRCLINKQCSVHTHIGEVTFTKENIVLMYYVYQNVQKEVFSMMPISRRNNEYCKYLEYLPIDLKKIKEDRLYWIDYYYNDIIYLLSKKDFAGPGINKKKDHPKGFKCGYDHNTARYCWVNFIPAVFKTRFNGDQTIEFRAMSGTTSYNKVKHWLLICFALVDIVDNNKQYIYNNGELTLENILKICYPKDSAPIIDYVNGRKVKFTELESRIKEKVVEVEDYEDNEIDNNFKIKSL